MLKLTGLIKDYLDRGERCIGVFLDLQKAFDTVSIPILLARLENTGIRGVALEWFTSYLTDREQRTRVGELESDAGYSRFGLPQGSTLGPTLFIIYVNELCKIALPGMDLLMFADDTVLLFHDKTWQSAATLAENGLSKVTGWLEDNLLSLHIGKTKYICFTKTITTSPDTDFHLTIHTYPCNRRADKSEACSCEQVARTDNIKYLGVTVDSNLSWKCHIANLSTRVRKLIYVFKNLRTIASNKLLIQTYKALCECIINYCICVWGNAAKTHLIDVERAQRAVLKVLLYLPHRHPTTDVYERAKVLSVRKVFIMKVLTRYHSKIVPSLATSRKRVDRCPVPRARSRMARKHFDVVAPLLYNKLNKIYKRNIKTYSNKEVKKHILTWLNDLNYSDVEDMLGSM